MPEEGIAKEEILHRIERVKTAAASRGLKGLLAIARPFFERPANVAYLANHFPPFPTGMYWGEMRGMGHSVLILPLAGDPVLIVDTTYRRDLVPIRRRATCAFQVGAEDVVSAELCRSHRRRPRRKGSWVRRGWG